ncbi:hypothetical protein [Paracandidimonas soli]|uniref:hypothetical protein n=1 Tax=Paracandidimonas soli TaxID=1917182 RepID=UPI001A9DDD55|nr:hypothetical protein [Paracandidimonas soli]
MNKYAAVFTLSFWSAIAHAQDFTADQSRQPPSVEEGRSAWALQVTPYLWAAGLKGNISPFKHAPTMAVDKSFSDVIDDLNVGGFINVWGRRDRFVFSADVMYVNTSDAYGKGPLPAFQLPGFGSPIPPGSNLKARIDSKQLTATLQGGYRVVDTPAFTLDVLGGARFWHISTDISVTASHPAIGVQTARHNEKFDWIDPLVGVRAFLPVTESLSFQVQADAGGFGAGGSRTWSTLATVNYVFSDRLSASAGYKALDVDYDHGGHVYDIRLRGPVLGLTYRF